MFEYSTLQEAYTGALVAGKGKLLNNISVIMERARLPIQEWVRVRFGAGVPWRRCWCVIEPPSEKEYQKAQKELKKRSPYDRSHAPALKGEIRFYDSKKEADKKKKHSKPIATITDAYSAYALYPQSKALIDSSTLLKIEGHIDIHSDPPSAADGFVFVMPEVPPAVSGFEMLLRFLFPTWDIFNLYGRPGRLVASVLDPRSLMFAMPKHKKYGYLETLDVSGLIHTAGSGSWSEREWRKKLKELTGQRMTTADEGDATHSRSGSNSSKRLSFGPQNPAAARPRVGFADDAASNRSSRSLSLSRPGHRTDSAPPDPLRERVPSAMAAHSRHVRNNSDPALEDGPSHGFDGPPPRPQDRQMRGFASDLASTPERVSSEDDMPGRGGPPAFMGDMRRMHTPEPVNAPPAFSHNAGSRPQQAPQHSPDMRRANNRLSQATLSQLANANGLSPEALTQGSGERQFMDGRSGSAPSQIDPRGPAVQPQASANPVGMYANVNASREALTSPSSTSSRPSPRFPPADMGLSQQRSRSPLAGHGPPPAGGPLSRPGQQMGPPPHGHGGPPMMNPRGSPPDGRGLPPGSHDPRMGPPQRGPPDGYSRYQQRGPPPGPRRTPPPGQGPQPPLHAGGSPPINRKPLPPRTASIPGSDGNGSAPQSPGNGPIPFSQQGLQVGDLIYANSAPPAVPPHHPQRQHNEHIVVSNQHDDASSTTSPDYASTRRSTDTQNSVDRPIDRPRAGVLKTTGNDPAGPGTGSSMDPSEYSVPDINFGPTINYAASKIPTSASSAPLAPQQASLPDSGRRSPGPGPAYSHFRQESDDTIRRGVPWHPSGTGTGAAMLADGGLSSGQFAQQHAAAAAANNTPAFTHQRNLSSNMMTDFKASIPNSPQKRPGSRNATHSRHNSTDLLYGGRPASQGTAVAFSGGEVSSHLSAREQEHIARVTGSPLIALGANRPPSQSSIGLVGAIQTRERERAQMKAGIGGQAVAQAIDQRTREQNQQAQRAAQAAYAQQQAQFASQGFGNPQGGGMMYGTPAAGMGPPRVGPGYQQGPGYGAPHMRPQGGPPQGGQQQAGWNATLQHRPPPLQPPSPGYGMQSGQPQSPGFQPPPQGQYAASGTPGRPDTPGRMQFQGQAF